MHHLKTFSSGLEGVLFRALLLFLSRPGTNFRVVITGMVANLRTDDADCALTHHGDGF